jgi:hypothetical protein
VLHRELLGAPATAIDGLDLLALGVKVEAEDIAADTRARGLRHVEGGRGRDGSISGVAAEVEDLEPGLGRQRLARGDHAFRAIDCRPPEGERRASAGRQPCCSDGWRSAPGRVRGEAELVVRVDCRPGDGHVEACEGKRVKGCKVRKAEQVSPLSGGSSSSILPSPLSSQNTAREASSTSSTGPVGRASRRGEAFSAPPPGCKAPPPPMNARLGSDSLDD